MTRAIKLPPCPLLPSRQSIFRKLSSLARGPHAPTMANLISEPAFPPNYKTLSACDVTPEPIGLPRSGLATRWFGPLSELRQWQHYTSGSFAPRTDTTRQEQLLLTSPRLSHRPPRRRQPKCNAPPSPGLEGRRGAARGQYSDGGEVFAVHTAPRTSHRIQSNRQKQTQTRKQQHTSSPSFKCSF